MDSRCKVDCCGQKIVSTMYGEQGLCQGKGTACRRRGGQNRGGGVEAVATQDGHFSSSCPPVGFFLFVCFSFFFFFFFSLLKQAQHFILLVPSNSEIWCALERGVHMWSLEQSDTQFKKPHLVAFASGLRRVRLETWRPIKDCYGCPRKDDQSMDLRDLRI